jgi:hypothetical protein
VATHITQVGTMFTHRIGHFLDSLDRTGIPKIFLVFYFGGEAAKIKNQKINFFLKLLWALAMTRG